MQKQICTLFAISLAAVACGKESTSNNSDLPTPKAVEQAPTPVKLEPAATDVKPASSAAKFADELVAALSSADAAGVVALTLTPEDVRPVLEAVSAACPEEMPAEKIDEGVKGMSGMLGTSEERLETYSGYHADCRKLSDFAGASVVSIDEQGKEERCGTTKIRNLVIETNSGGKTVYVRINDLMETSNGWRMPDPFWCSSEKPKAAE